MVNGISKFALTTQSNRKQDMFLGKDDEGHGEILGENRQLVYYYYLNNKP